MRKTWFHGLALTLGVSTLTNVTWAQYGNTSGAGLSASSFNANNPTQVRSFAAPQTSLAGYTQNGAVGSGVPSGHVHVPIPSTVENPVLSTQYQVAPNYAAPAAQPYEQMPMTSVQPSVQTPMAVPQAASAPVGVSSCPACNAGNCSAHGVGGPAIPMSTGAACGTQCAEAAPAMSCGPSIASPSPWIFGASALVFNRLDNHNVALTHDSNSPDYPVLTTDQARSQASGGVQFSVGRYFGCGRYALVGTYWGVFSDPQSYTVTTPAGGNLRSNLPFTVRGPGGASTPYGIEMPAQFVYDWYDGAAAHRIVRDQEYHNIEINLFSFALGGGARQPYEQTCSTGCGGGGGGLFHRGRGSAAAGSCGDVCGDPCGSACGPAGPTGPCAPWFGAQCSKLRLNTFGGIRWFRFQDSLEYGASTTDAVFGTTADDFYYANDVTNDLLGFQFGTLANWCTGTRLNLYAGTSFGIYGNHIQANTRAGTTDTVATILSTNSFNGRDYNYQSSLTDIAFLGEGNVGAGIRICRGWTANIGYRVVGVNGVATATGQIPRDFSNGNEINRINNYNSLVLHGLVVGAMYNF